MRKFAVTSLVFISVLFVALPCASAQYDSLQTHVQQLMDSVQIAEGNIFAPGKFAKAVEKYDRAQQAIEREKKQSIIEQYFSEAAEYLEQALSATGTCKLTLEEYLPAREKAKTAKAPSLVPDLYAIAEEQFVKATSKVESGDVKGGLKEATKATPLFDTAELEAIRVDIMGTADALIEKAVIGEAEKFALSTLDRARTSRAKCDAIITKDRYARGQAMEEIARAEYEARHALTIATSVRSLKRNDQAWEKLMLGYEIEMNRVAATAGISQLPFDHSPTEAADSLIASINRSHSNIKSADDLETTVADKLLNILARLGSQPSKTGPDDLADLLDSEVLDLITERDSMKAQANQADYQLSQLQEDHQIVAAELKTRTEQEEKFKKAKQLISPAEGDVLYNASNDIVLRLSGLSFDVGKSDIKPDHAPLLDKVIQIIDMFEGSKVVVEGHTDASGDPAANLALSEKRAFAVMQYIRTSTLMGADRISAIGFGSEKPVGPNNTKEGRAKNRRIDIIIMR